MTKNQGIGAAVRRKEDRRFLTGQGRFVADLALPGALWMHILRSPHAHARIARIETGAAAAAAGVAAALSGADMAADGVRPMQPLWIITGKDGKKMALPPRWALARGTVRHVGEPVAIVIAETAAQAADAAELIAIDYEELPAVVGAVRALEPGAAQLHPEAPGNLCAQVGRGDEARVRAAFAVAKYVVGVEVINNRLICAALEPRVVAANPEPLTLWSSTQAPHHIRRHVTEELGLPEGALRVIAPDVGGGFGTKGKHHPEETLAVWAARRLGRPVRWTASRSESFVSDAQGRDHATTAQLALDSEGNFLAVRVDTIADVGAYVSTFGASIPSAIYSALLAGVYKTPAVYVEVTTAFTNTVPTDAYRGAGRPEACYVLERLADKAAAALKLDRAEIRRRNLIPPTAMPYKTPLGPTYDNGDYPRLLSRALEIAGYAGFEARRAEAERRGKRRGIGMALYVESSGVAPSKLAGAMGARAGFFESAEIRVGADGSVTAFLGTHNHGQGHATTFAQVLSTRLGVPLERIDIVEGDTAMVPYGTGTFGSRSMAVGGSALSVAADKVIAKGKRLAAHLLEAAEADIGFDDSAFRVTGTDRRIGFDEVAHAANVAHRLPPGMEPGLHESAFFDPVNFAFSAGCHVAEIEIDPETGVAALIAHCVVDDIGTVINPMVVEGQVHGGLAQGIGQVLFEHAAVDPQSGQVLAGSFMDYALPRAGDLPSCVTETDESQPYPLNPLGAKGCGESGTIGAPAAIVGAVLDALAPLGIDHIDMPLTPQRLWAMLQSRT
ncbi:MAG TPA: xanthine dehydrogenase family protein molybdopterin-binding subunit [Alphaproteobacteria bacterium]|nr:xanthine dehydrogenase family protein molybdopterin-binding subunit [Alphaproteobacteria bacterium]